MKKITYLLISSVLILGSCSKVLDVEPTASISSETALNDKVGIERATIGSYTALQAAGLYGRNRVIVGDLAADNLKWTGTTYEYYQIENNDVPADNAIIEGTWIAAYDGLNRVNNVLNALSSVADLTDAERDKYEGEALFMRALFHFNLLTYFGGVPIKTTPTLDISNVNQARNPADQVYEQIIADLLQAESKLPVTMPVGRANSYAASALLARVYLTRFHTNGNAADATAAVDMAGKVITEGGFSLVTPYAALFEGSNSEVIFEIVFDVQNKNRLAEYFFPRSLAGRYEVAPSDELVQSYEAGDQRLAASIATDVENKVYGTKYEQLSAGSDAVFVLRLAEMYMIKAEALAYSNGSILSIQESINALRSRAGLEPTTAETYDALKLAIENERRHEFAFEGHRWFDLVRTKRATGLLGIDEDYTYFPIPLSEMQTNNLMKQNDGY
ncbi:MAG: RagB/SusD family nutrient uptake outer membrane protein [Bacteroidales bacterium]|nr:RagB/SusD family nutrient uptake outer membrane protein [Bacteroidales bacterium]